MLFQQHLSVCQPLSATQSNLGAMYANGTGVPQDYVRAYMWFNLSAATGYQPAIKYRDTLAQRMTPAQIAEAQKLASEWRPGPSGMEPQNSGTPDDLRRAVLDVIIKGQDRTHLLGVLQAQYGAATAQKIMTDALEEYSTLKSSGRLADYEYDLYFKRTKHRMTKKQAAGLSLMLIGIGMTALSYLTTVFSTAPNQKYIAFVGIIIAGAFMFMSTGHD